MNPLGIGILGASKIAPAAIIAPAKENPAVALTAIAARDPERARAFAQTHGINKALQSYQAIIDAQDVDLVYNGLPPALHREWTIRALAAGKHVLLEKPSGMNAYDAAAMTEAATKYGRRLIEAFHYRYHPLFQRIIEIVQTELGTIKTAEALFEVPIPDAPGEIRYEAALGGGALMDLGCYPVHWLRTLCGEPKVRSATQILHPRGADLSTRALLGFSDGAVGHMSCSMSPESGRPMASLKLTTTNGEMTVLNPLAPQWGHALTWRRHGDAEHTETVSSRSTYAYQLDAVVAALSTGAPLPTESEDIGANMRAIDAIRAAALRD